MLLHCFHGSFGTNVTIGITALTFQKDIYLQLRFLLTQLLIKNLESIMTPKLEIDFTTKNKEFLPWILYKVLMHILFSHKFEIDLVHYYLPPLIAA